MAIDKNNNPVKVGRVGVLKRVENLDPHPSAAEYYNYIRVQMPDGKENHFLFTDNEIEDGKNRAKRNPEDIPKEGWGASWKKKFSMKSISDLRRVANQNPHHLASNEYNYILVETDEGKTENLLFTDNEISNAYDRGLKNPEDCPEVSWIVDLLD